MPPEVQFVSEENGQPCHKYLVEGREVPGLSYILSSNGFLRYDRVNKQVMEAARERGDAADQACNLFNEDFPKIDKFTCDIQEWEASALSEPLDEWTRSRLLGWIKFRRDFKFNVLFIQKRMAHEFNGMAYAFTLDCYGQMDGKYAIVEVKATAECEPSHAIQTLAQSLPFRDSTCSPTRWGAYLRENDYRIEQFTDRFDEKIFGCMLAVTWYKWGKGIK